MKRIKNSNSVTYKFNPQNELEVKLFCKELKKRGFNVKPSVIIEMYKLHNADYKVYLRLNNNYFLYAPCSCNPFYVILANYNLPNDLEINKIKIA